MNYLIAIFYKFIAYPLKQIYYFIFRPQTQGVKAIIQYQNSLLFIKNTYGYSFWNFPGGGVKSKESPKKAISREVEEEVGLKLKKINFCGSFVNKSEYKRDSVYVFYVKTDNPNFRIDPKEIKEAKWIKIKQIKSLSLRPVVKKSLELAKISF